MRDLVRGARLIFTAGFRCAPRLALVGFFMEPAGGLLQTFTALWLRAIIDGATTGDVAAVKRATLGLAGTTAGSYVILRVGWRYRRMLLERTGAWLDERIMEMSSDLPGLEHHERAEYHDRMQQLGDAGFGESGLGIVGWIASSVHLIAVTALLASLHPALMLLPLFGVPSVVIGARVQRRVHEANQTAAERWRRSAHLYRLAIEPSSAKELRVFGLEDEIATRHDRERESATLITARAEIRAAAWAAVGWSIFAVGYLGAIGLVAFRAAGGHASVGDVVFALTLASQVNGDVSDLVEAVRWLSWSLRSAEHFLWLEDQVRSSRRGHVGSPPEAMVRGIRFEGLSFAYPGTGSPVLRDIDLDLPAGTRIAIVGDNGAGKSTLVKLLCGFYDPTAGRITIDDADLALMDTRAWRARLAAGFQDYCRFELIARESVGVGDLPRIDDDVSVRAALGRAGAEELPGVLPNGLATVLGTSFDDGVDLSTGQWQKVALGRAMMRPAPLVLILDEPTASLDARTEQALFRRYSEAASARASDGAITLLVSHRFSTVRSADLIVVVSGGRVIETGSHDELMASDGLYAELFTLQASGYR